jgi:hypothetical protein
METDRLMSTARCLLKTVAIGASIVVVAVAATGAAQALTCYAQSPTGARGWASSRHLAVARAGALRYCDSFGHRCVITSCR